MSNIERQAFVNVNTLDKQMAVLAERFDTLEEKLDSILRSLDDMPNKYVSNDRFKPVEQFYKGTLGVATVILLAILGLVLAHVIPGLEVRF